ncbi:hypothetical protein ANN_16129 [Periplaneta americana]|uniref:alpha-glucosidase n=1 Tax=Periplaneta americana TaxID=6978 RepID=A0ABQ8SJC2_PERAM|nr:hypothetical protein ANN_16129 [Periplaneta americana]
MLSWHLIAVIGTAVATPFPEMPQPTLDWWQTAVIYHIYPRSFKDSNGDGIGDLKGIIERFGHIKDLGVGAIWLSPIYPSPNADFGYDISNFTDVDPAFGTLGDFDNLVSLAKENDVKIIMDFVPNHSSDEHDWFLKSLHKIDPYTDFYTWHDGKLDESGNRIPPNNWVSIFNSQSMLGEGSAWSWRDERKQFYLHQFQPKQPDLNYRNAAVVEEMKNVLRFWLDRGVDGFRVDSVQFLFEGPVNVSDGEKQAQQILSKTVDMVAQWRKVLDHKSAESENNKVLLVEVHRESDNVTAFYGNSTVPVAHLHLNFRLFHLHGGPTARDVSNTINNYMDLMIGERWPNWVLGSHDQHRVASRLGAHLVDAMNILAMLLPGVAVTYYGEEIGMENTYVTWEQCRDVRGVHSGSDRYLERTRDLERAPFHWDNTTSAGFSSNSSTWLPLNNQYKNLSLAQQRREMKSHYKVYKQLMDLRKTRTIQHGNYEVAAVNDNVLVVSRYSRCRLLGFIYGHTLLHCNQSKRTPNQKASASAD